MAMACSSHERTPMKANLGATSSDSSTLNSAPVRSALHRRVAGGKTYFFHEYGPTA